MLDDLKYIHQRDKSDALGVAEKQWQQLQQNYELTLEKAEVTNVVFAGMGGSALAAEVSKTWPGYKVPFEICRGYNIPAYVGPGTLFIASSYSGNTEETLTALDEARTAGAQTILITSGGKLQEIGNNENLPFELLPQVTQPRFGVFYSLKALVTVLEKAGLLAEESANQSLYETAEFIKEEVTKWLPTVPAKDNLAKKLAQEVMGRSAVIYSGPKLYPAAYKWKINFNENAKNVAWCNQYPEMNHNEFLGWTSHPEDKPYAVIELRSNFEHERVQKRFEVTDRLLSGKRPAPEVVNAEGDTLLKQLLWTIVLGDFVSLYLALLNGLDPTPVELIEKLKTALK